MDDGWCSAVWFEVFPDCCEPAAGTNCCWGSPPELLLILVRSVSGFSDFPSCGLNVELPSGRWSAHLLPVGTCRHNAATCSTPVMWCRAAACWSTAYNSCIPVIVGVTGHHWAPLPVLKKLSGRRESPSDWSCSEIREESLYYNSS